MISQAKAWPNHVESFWKQFKASVRGTHIHISAKYMQRYLDEFTFRFNRRTSQARGLLFFRLLEQAAVTDPVRYRDLVVTAGSGNRNARPPGPKRIAPGTLALAPLDRPWRHASR